MSELGGFWIGFPLDNNGTHVTLVVRIGAMDHDVQMLKNLLEYQVKPLLPLRFEVDHTVTMKGSDFDVPTHSIKIVEPLEVHQILADIYRTFYMVPPGEESFPEWSAHVTVKKDTAKATVDHILNYQGGQGIIGRAELYTWNGEDPIHVVKC